MHHGTNHTNRTANDPRIDRLAEIRSEVLNRKNAVALVKRDGGWPQFHDRTIQLAGHAEGLEESLKLVPPTPPSTEPDVITVPTATNTDDDSEEAQS
jgi:hypothetical protein